MTTMKEAAAQLLDAIDAAGPTDRALYYVAVGVTGAEFAGGVVAVFQQQLKAVADRLT